MCFTYGCWFGAKALRAVGETVATSAPQQKVTAFLQSKQRADGGWGETYISCQDKVYDQITGQRPVLPPHCNCCYVLFMLRPRERSHLSPNCRSSCTRQSIKSRVSVLLLSSGPSACGHHPPVVKPHGQGNRQFQSFQTISISHAYRGLACCEHSVGDDRAAGNGLPQVQPRASASGCRLPHAHAARKRRLASAAHQRSIQP